MKYDVSNKIVSHQKRFDSIGAWNINDGFIRDSILYFTNLYGDLGKVANIDSSGTKLFSGEGRSRNRIIGDSIYYILGDSLGIEVFNPDLGTLTPWTSPTSTYEGLRDGIILGDSLLVSVGDRGYLGFHSSGNQKFQRLLNGSFNFRSIIPLSDSVLFIGSDLDMALIFSLNDSSIYPLRFLPKSQHGLGFIDEGNSFLWYSEEGGIYRLNKQQLVSMALDIKELKGPKDLGFFQVYPQPVTDYLQIESSEALQYMEVRNLAGQLLERRELHLRKNVRISLAHLKKGRYVLSAISKEGKKSSLQIIKAN